MRITQLKGPFKANTTYTCPMPAGRYQYIQIGIQAPQVPPISEVNLEDMTSLILSLNNKEFKVNAADILEFTDIAVTTNPTITPQQDMDRYTIIDIAYTAIEE